MKYVRVMDGLKSNAGGFEYKLDEINIAHKWDTSTLEPEQMGGFNYGTEDFNYGVWYKDGLHNVYTYLNGITNEYEYFIEDGKIRLEEVTNKQYKR